MSPPPCLQTGEGAVLYDGVCKLCNGWVTFLRCHHLARQAGFASVQSEQGKAWLRYFPGAVTHFACDCIALNRYKPFVRYRSQHAIKPDYPGRFLHALDIPR